MQPIRHRCLQEGQSGNGPVVYWMSRDQRVMDNWALHFAQEQALARKTACYVLFCLTPHFLGATRRHYDFMLKGLTETARLLSQYGIGFEVLLGDIPLTLSTWLAEQDASLLVTDFDPLRIKRQWKDELLRRVRLPVYEVDTHNIVPCWLASPKAEYGAYTLRPKLHRQLVSYLTPLPELRRHPWPANTPSPDWEKLTQALPLQIAPAAVDWLTPGSKAALSALHRFIQEKLANYDEWRNDPTRPGQSQLSPYLHFGQISPQRVAWEVSRSSATPAAKAAFLEELIVRRELADNFCWYRPDYDQFSCFPAWAQQTLDLHRGDPRPYLYTQQELEAALTHDPLWNAAQREMVRTGKMHGYMRMYWAKKILEWSETPEIALSTAISLNDTYQLDGRDPNGYAGIAWSIGGIHDRAWNERAIFGKVRFMSYNSTKTKFNSRGYMEAHQLTLFP